MKPDFIELATGAIGQLSYYKKDKIKLSAKEEQKKIDEFTSQRISAMIMQKCMGQSPDLNQAYSKSRTESKDDLNAVTTNMKIVNIHYQIGQQDSYDELIAIETTSDFGGWINPIQIENIKEAHIIS